jgi:hypothetical protein
MPAQTRHKKRIRFISLEKTIRGQSGARNLSNAAASIKQSNVAFEYASHAFLKL